jgi:hypothetical protein
MLSDGLSANHALYGRCLPAYLMFRRCSIEQPNLMNLTLSLVPRLFLPLWCFFPLLLQKKVHAISSLREEKTIKQELHLP